MLTEAVCTRHQLCRSEEELLRVAEHQREKQGEQQGKPHAMEEGEKMGYVPFSQIQCPVKINQNGYQRMTEMLKDECCIGEKWMSRLWVKLKGFSGFCISSGGFREGFVLGG